MQVGPARRNPLLIAVQADFGVEAVVDDLPRDQLRKQRAPPVALGVVADFARERLVAEQKALGQVEHRLPELAFDAARAAAMLVILRGQRAAQRLALDVQPEHRLEPRRRAVGIALGQRAQLGQDGRVRRQRIVRRKGREPPFGGLGVRQRVLDRLAETEHFERASSGRYDICTSLIVVSR